MAEIQASGNGPRNQKKRFKRHVLRMDMTPMVDLAFLLLTFFILSSTLTKPKTMELTFPVPSGDPSPHKNGITFLLGDKDHIFYYEGEFRGANNKQGAKTQLAALDFSSGKANSLHEFLLRKNRNLQSRIRQLDQQHRNKQLSDSVFHQLVKQAKSDKDEYTYLVKTDNKATYKNVIDMIDELNINLAGKYVIADISASELGLMKHAEDTPFR